MGVTTIEAVGISKNFGRVRALDNVNLSVSEGEVFGFIGPNGAGKTTTIRILLGILQAGGGTARVFGLDAWRDALEIHHRIATVPGDVNLWPNLTGGEVIDLFVSLRNKQDRARRDRYIKMFELDPSKKCRSYSKGNRQKVALVAAFTSDADLYILDEPTSGLDPLMEQVFQECVSEAKQAGKSVFLSSHILSEVEKLCDRVGIIRDGHVVETGTLAELRHLTRTSIYLETKKPIEGLERFDGVFDLAKRQNGLAFQLDSDKLPEFIVHLAGYGVTKLESTPATLEDLFMRHYETDGGN